MPPYQGGGEMIRTVTFEQTTFKDIPHKFEAGTPDIAGAHRLRRGARLPPRARDYDAIQPPTSRAAGLRHRDQLEQLPGLRLIGTAEQQGQRCSPSCSTACTPTTWAPSSTRGRGGPHRSPLRPAGDGPLRGSGHRAGLPGPLQHPRRRGRPGGRAGRRCGRSSADVRAARAVPVGDSRPQQASPGTSEALEDANHAGGRRQPAVRGQDHACTVAWWRTSVVQGPRASRAPAVPSPLPVGLADDPGGQGPLRWPRCSQLFEAFPHAGDLGSHHPERSPRRAAWASSPVFAGVREFPMRVKCATLGWHTLRAALDESGATVTTE